MDTPNTNPEAGHLQKETAEAFFKFIKGEMDFFMSLLNQPVDGGTHSFNEPRPQMSGCATFESMPTANYPVEPSNVDVDPYNDTLFRNVWETIKLWEIRRKVTPDGQYLYSSATTAEAMQIVNSVRMTFGYEGPYNSLDGGNPWYPEDFDQTVIYDQTDPVFRRLGEAIKKWVIKRSAEKHPSLATTLDVNYLYKVVRPFLSCSVVGKSGLEAGLSADNQHLKTETKMDVPHAGIAKDPFAGASEMEVAISDHESKIVDEGIKKAIEFLNSLSQRAQIRFLFDLKSSLLRIMTNELEKSKQNMKEIIHSNELGLEEQERNLHILNEI